MAAPARALIVLALAGCGRVGFDATGDAPDAPRMDAGCAFGPWGGPQHLTQLSTGRNDWEPALSPDGRTLVYASGDSLQSDLMMTTSSTPAGAFGAPVHVLEMGFEYGPTWSADGATLFFSLDDAHPVLMAADFAGGAFSNVRQVPDVTDALSVALSDDERELFYTMDQGGSQYDLGHATRANPGDAWVVDALLDGFNRTTASEGWPSWDEAHQTLYWEAQHPTDNGTDIVMATRPARGQPFGAAATVILNAADPELSRDGLTMLYDSGPTDADLFLETRPCH